MVFLFLVILLLNVQLNLILLLQLKVLVILLMNLLKQVIQDYISFHNSPTLSHDSDVDKDAISYPGAGVLQTHKTLDVSHYMNINSTATLVNKPTNISDISSITTATTATTSPTTPVSPINHSNFVNTDNNTSMIENSSSLKITDNNSSIIENSNSLKITNNNSLTVSNSNVFPNRLNSTRKEEKVTIPSPKFSPSLSPSLSPSMSPTISPSLSPTPLPSQLSPDSVSNKNQITSTIVASPKSENDSLSPVLGGQSPNQKVQSAPVTPSISKNPTPEPSISRKSTRRYSPSQSPTQTPVVPVRKQSSHRGEFFFNHLFKRKSHSSIQLNQLNDDSTKMGNKSDFNNNIIKTKNNGKDLIPPPRTDSKNQTINKHTWKTLLKSSKQGSSLFRRSKENLKSGLRSFQKSSKPVGSKSLNDLANTSLNGLKSSGSDISRSSSRSIRSTKSESKGNKSKSTSQQKLYTRKSFSTGATSSLTALIKSYQNNELDSNFLTIPNMEVIEKKVNTFENNDKLKKIKDESNNNKNNTINNDDSKNDGKNNKSDDKILKIDNKEENKDKDAKLKESKSQNSLESFPPLKEKSKSNEKINKSKSKNKGKTPAHPPWNEDNFDDEEYYDYIDEMDILYSIKAENEFNRKKNNKKKCVKSRSKIIFSGSKGWYPEEPVVSLVKENGEIKGYYAPGEKYTAGERNSIGSRIRHNSLNNYDKKSFKGNIVNPSKRPIPSIILTERTETNSSTSSLIPPPHFLKDFSKRQQIVEEDELNTDISDDNEDYDDLDIPLVINKNYKSNPLSSTPVNDIIIGPKELEKIDIKDEILTKSDKKEEQNNKQNKKSLDKSLDKSLEKSQEIQQDKPLEKSTEKSSEKSSEKQEENELEISPLPPPGDELRRKSAIKNRPAIKRPLKTKESYDFIDDLLVKPQINSAPPFTSSKPINIKAEKGKDYHSHPTSPSIIIQPSTPTQNISVNYTNALGTISNNSSNSSLASTISSTVKPSYSAAELNLPTLPSLPSTSSNTSFTVLSLPKNAKKLNKVGRRGAFYDHKNDPDLLSVSIPSTISRSYSSNGSESFSTTTTSPQSSTFNYQSFNNIPGNSLSQSPLLTSSLSPSMENLALPSVNNTQYSSKNTSISGPMYVEPDQISTSMSSSGEEDFEDEIYNYRFTPSYSLDVECETDHDIGFTDHDIGFTDRSNDMDSASYPILPDEHYIANFSANGVKPQIPSFERDDNEDDKAKGKRARAKSDSRCIMDDKGNGMRRIDEEETDGLLHPTVYGGSHKRLNSTSAFINIDKKLDDDNDFNDDLEMPNLLSQDLYSKILRKKFQRAVRIINIVRRLSSKSSVSSSSYTYNSNINDISETSSFYSSGIAKLDPKKNSLSVGNHSRTSSVSSSLSNVITPSVNSEVLVLTPSYKDNKTTEIKSIVTSEKPFVNTPVSPALSECNLVNDKGKGPKEIKINEEKIEKIDKIDKIEKNEKDENIKIKEDLKEKKEEKLQVKEEQKEIKEGLEEIGLTSSCCKDDKTSEIKSISTLEKPIGNTVNTIISPVTSEIKNESVKEADDMKHKEVQTNEDIKEINEIHEQKSNEEKD
eukprot:jgi/Orpsp1_1/1189985/evm.model.d7180000075936.2